MNFINYNREMKNVIICFIKKKYLFTLREAVAVAVIIRRKQYKLGYEKN